MEVLVFTALFFFKSESAKGHGRGEVKFYSFNHVCQLCLSARSWQVTKWKHTFVDWNCGLLDLMFLIFRCPNKISFGLALGHQTVFDWLTIRKASHFLFFEIAALTGLLYCVMVLVTSWTELTMGGTFCSVDSAAFSSHGPANNPATLLATALESPAMSCCGSAPQTFINPRLGSPRGAQPRHSGKTAHSHQCPLCRGDTVCSIWSSRNLLYRAPTCEKFVLVFVPQRCWLHNPLNCEADWGLDEYLLIAVDKLWQ